MTSSNGILAIVSHDAGGAEILSSFLLHNPQKCYLVLEGPAISIFERKLGVCILSALDVAIRECSWVLCGSSWQSNLEKQAIIKARLCDKKVITFLDHWVNYIERFQIDGKQIFPDEVWVGDDYAKVIAHQVFPTIKVNLMTNFYLQDVACELRIVQQKINVNHSSVLYVCEPIREHAFIEYGDERYWGYTEEEALLFFLNNLAALKTPIASVVVRPHPSEKIDKYCWVKNCAGIVIETNSTKSLIDQVCAAAIVVGCNSMAMVVALLAGKRVISSIPYGGKGCSLPQSNIEHLQQLIVQFKGAEID